MNDVEISFETGRFAHLADGSVYSKHGSTSLLTTVVSETKNTPGVDFMPLSVEFR